MTEAHRGGVLRIVSRSGEELLGHGIGHGLICRLARVEMVTAVVAGPEASGAIFIAHRSIEIDATVEHRVVAQPFVEILPYRLALVIVCAPALDGQKSAVPDLHVELSGMSHVDVPNACLEVVGGRHIAPWAERIDVYANGVDNVVYAVLDDDSISACNVHLDRETGRTLQSIGLVCYAIILSEDTRPAHGTADDGDIAESGIPSADGEIVRPALRGYGIAIADEGAVGRKGMDLDGIEEIEPVGLAREVEREGIGIGEIAIGVLTVGQGTCDERPCVHLCEGGEIDADLDGVAGGDGYWQIVGRDLAARLDGHGGFAAEKELVVLTLGGDMGDNDFGERDGLSACQVGESEAQAVSAEDHANRVAQRDILGVDSLFAVSDGGGVTPASDPFDEVAHLLKSYADKGSDFGVKREGLERESTDLGNLRSPGLAVAKSGTLSVFFWGGGRAIVSSEDF